MTPILKKLIDSNVILSGRCALTMKYKRVTVDIDLNADGTLSWNDQLFPNPSNFSLSFKKRINPQVQSDNGFHSILYNGKPLTMYVELYNAELELKAMQSQYEIFRDKCKQIIDNLS
jgi:hypothetical protein